MSDPSHEPWNYFNYFTETEDHFRRARGTGMFLMSPVDWALIEAWKNAGIPLEAVLRGIDAAFEKWRARPGRRQQVNSLAYCAQAVMEEAQVLAGAAPPKREVEAPFPLEALKTFLEQNVQAVRARGAQYEEVAQSLERILADAEQHFEKLEDLEQRLTVLEEKMSAIARTTASEDALLAARRELDSALRPYRGKMTADQLAMLERQFLEKRLLEGAQLPRLSLFYLG